MIEHARRLAPGDLEAAAARGERRGMDQPPRDRRGRPRCSPHTRSTSLARSTTRCASAMRSTPSPRPPPPRGGSADAYRSTMERLTVLDRLAPPRSARGWRAIRPLPHDQRMPVAVGDLVAAVEGAWRYDRIQPGACALRGRPPRRAVRPDGCVRRGRWRRRPRCSTGGSASAVQPPRG